MKHTIHTLLSWLLTPLFLVACIITLVVWHPLLVFFSFVNQRAFWWMVSFGNGILLFHLRIMGFSVSAAGLDKLPAAGPVIVVSNHQSFFDIPLYLWFFRHLQPRFIAKQELAKCFPSASYVLRRGGSALIDRKNPKQATEAIKSCGALCASVGSAVVIFPEGTRSRDGKLRNFKAGGVAALLSAMPDVPVVIAAVSGSCQIMAKRFLPVPYGGELTLTVLEVVTAANFSSADQLTEYCKKAIARSLGLETGS